VDAAGLLSVGRYRRSPAKTNELASRNGRIGAFSGNPESAPESFADRADNFDIFLPEWLARHNKLVFGTIFALGELLLVWPWLGMTGR
jgi:hypothetical protein